MKVSKGKVIYRGRKRFTEGQELPASLATKLERKEKTAKAGRKSGAASGDSGIEG
jgi:hypothetical protein